MPFRSGTRQGPEAIRQDLLKRGLTEKVAGKVIYDAMVQVHGESDLAPPKSRLPKLLVEALTGVVTAAAAFGLFTGTPQLIDMVAGWLGPWARIDARLAVPVLGLLLAGLGFAIRTGLAENLSAAAHLIHGSSGGRFRITYCPGHLTREEIEGAQLMGEGSFDKVAFAIPPVFG